MQILSFDKNRQTLQKDVLTLCYSDIITYFLQIHYLELLNYMKRILKKAITISLTSLTIVLLMPGYAGAALPALPVIDRASLNSVKTFSTVAVSTTSLALNGAHHRPLMLQKTGAADNCVWASGDYGEYDRKNADSTLFEVGGCKDFMSGNLRAGIGLGMSRVNQDLVNTGTTEMEGQHILLELDYQVQDSSMLASVIGYFGDYDVDTNRVYETSPSVFSSFIGSTTVDVIALRARLDFKNIWSLGDASVSPYASLTITSSDVAAYTETGGTGAASYAARSHTAEELRLGASVETVLSEKSKVRVILEGVHRFDDSVEGVNGTVVATAFSTTDDVIEQTWGRIGAELNHQFQDDISLLATVFTSTTGEDSSLSAAISVQYDF